MISSIFNKGREPSPSSSAGKRTSSLRAGQVPALESENASYNDMVSVIDSLKRANQELRNKLEIKQMETIILRQSLKEAEDKSHSCSTKDTSHFDKEKKLQSSSKDQKGPNSKIDGSKSGITHLFGEDSLSEKAPAIPFGEKDLIAAEKIHSREMEEWSNDSDSSMEKDRLIAKLNSSLASQHQAMQLLLKLKEPVLQQNTALFKESGDIYHGEVLAGKRHGKGENLYPGGDIYKGSFEHDLASGKGVYTWKGGRREYRGDFDKGKRHGFGVYSEHNQIIYRGEWANGRRHGEGTANLADGSVYHGTFESNAQHGSGMKIDKTKGRIIIGRWEKGTLETEYQVYELRREEGKGVEMAKGCEGTRGTAKESKETKDSSNLKDSRDLKDLKEMKDSKDTKDNKDSKDSKSVWRESVNVGREVCEIISPSVERSWLGKRVWDEATRGRPSKPKTPLPPLKKEPLS